jgi:hypothetical protein
MNEGRSSIEILQSEGWARQFVACEPRLSEAVEAYMEAGFEVHLEPLPKKSDCQNEAGDANEGECRICFEGFEDQYRIIFTRPIRDDTDPEEDLF